MIGRRGMVVRRRPIMRAAAIGGTFAAGRSMGRRAEGQANAQADQDQRLGDLEAQQAQQPQQQAAPAQAGPGPSVMDQLSQLTALHQRGALTDDEFTAAKAKILGS
jgi:membrane protease subunit (stomatin/prohibitin family)